MRNGIKQALILVILAVLIGLVFNAFSGNGIAMIGSWPSTSGSEPAIPPSAEEGDPPFISLDEAAALYQTPGVIFIDARAPEDFVAGRIKGSINVPYDYLPDEGYDQYFVDLSKKIPYDTPVVIYCSGTECELSLYLGRDMVLHGFNTVKIFYGGWTDWENAELPTEEGE